MKRLSAFPARPSRDSLILLLVLSLLPCMRQAEAFSDPTRPGSYTAPDAVEKPTQALKLESVLIGSNRRVAVINGKTCRVGDSVDGARVVAIHADSAELVRDGNKVVLPLLKVKVRTYAQ